MNKPSIDLLTSGLLRTLREHHSLSLNGLSEKAQIPVDDLILFEHSNGRPTLAELDRICYVYGIPTLALIEIIGRREEYDREVEELENELKPIFDAVVRKSNG